MQQQIYKFLLSLFLSTLFQTKNWTYYYFKKLYKFGVIGLLHLYIGILPYFPFKNFSIFRRIVFEFTIIPRNSISWVGSKTHFLKFITNPRCCSRNIRESRATSISSIVFSNINRSSKNIIARIIKRLSTDIGTLNSLVIALGAGPSPKPEAKELVQASFTLKSYWFPGLLT